MPIKIPDALPARQVLESENVFVMTESRALSQDIRPLRILILNLMPTKITTETQLLRCLSNSPLQVDVELLRTSTHETRHTSGDHLKEFYKGFDEVRDRRYDGMIITGAPVEQMQFEDVDYWPELTKIMDWTLTNVTSTFHICWGAQAGLYYHYGVNKRPLREKMFGVYRHKVRDRKEPLFRGFDDYFFAPHSRHTAISCDDIQSHRELRLLADSEEAGAYVIMNAGRNQIFVTGHSEYDRDTLKGEYVRDLGRGLDIQQPANYFPNGDATADPVVLWRAHAHLLYTNWLNYYVYQATPYAL